jgi:hypothetical protein
LAKLEASVVFTDLPEVFYLLRRNIAANLDSRQQARTMVLEHCWGTEPLPELQVPWDLIVGADILYKYESVPPLIISLARMASPHTTVYLALEVRCEQTYERFRTLAAQDFDVSQLKTSKLDKDNEAVLVFRLSKK